MYVLHPKTHNTSHWQRNKEIDYNMTVILYYQTVYFNFIFSLTPPYLNKEFINIKI
jgi:hypothetical protein